MNQSNEINELATALAKAQGDMTAAKKDVVNPFFKSKYADLASAWDACRGPLTKHGLSVTQGVVFSADRYVLETVLRHASGQWVNYQMPLLFQKQDMQALGSAMSYARRYSLMAIIGLAQDDDDANLAAGKNNQNTVSNQAHPVQQRGQVQANSRRTDSAKSNSPRQASPRPQGGAPNPNQAMPPNRH